LKIAIYHNLPSGGAKRTLYEAMKRLSQRHTLDVYTLDTANREFCNLTEFTKEEFVFHFNPLKPLHSPFGRFNQLLRWLDLQKLDRLAQQIAKKIDAGKYDVVLAQPCMWTQAPLVLLYLKTPAIYYCHEPPRHLYGSSQAYRDARAIGYRKLDQFDPFISLYRKTARRMDKSATCAASLVLVNSIFIRDQVRRIYGLDPTISYHGVDTEIFKPEQMNRNENFVLSVGAIQPHKGFDFLIESLAYVSRGIRPSLYLIGNMNNPMEQDMLYGLAKEKGVDLHIEVAVDQGTLVKRYNEAMFVAYAPYNEPFGLAPLEGMACGKPIVGVDEGGVKETVVHQLTGLLVDRNAQKFGEAMQLLLKSPNLIARYGENGRRHVVDNWSWDKAVTELERHLCHFV
jgi:glycosyltransferase involved in cell wall biosynthesis